MRCLLATALAVGALALTPATTLASAPAQTNVQAVGSQALSFIFTLAGVVAALAGSVAGVRLIVSNALGSGYGAGQAISTLMVAGLGLLLALTGPNLAAEIVRGVPASTAIAGGGQAFSSWTGEVGRWIGILMQIGAVIAAGGISWNATLLILDALFAGAGEFSSAILMRILGTMIALGLLLGSTGIVNAVAGVLR